MKTAEEIFNEMAEIDRENVCLGNLFTMFKSKVIAAMEEYASQFQLQNKD